MPEEAKLDSVPNSGVSTVMSMLPASLQSRITPLPSLRRTMSLHSLRGGGPGRPRPLSEADAKVLTKQGSIGDCLTAVTTTANPSSTRSSSPTTYGEVTRDNLTRATSGIHWRFARQGFAMAQMAWEGDHSTTNDDEVAFDRKAYVDGVTYMLKGLPPALSPTEAEQILAALPTGVGADLVRYSGPDGQFIVRGRMGEPPPQQQQQRPRSLLHRTVQLTVMNLIMLFYLILPYLLVLAKTVAKMERKCKVSERAAGFAVEAVSSMSKKCVQLTGAVCRMNDGQVGKALSERIAWLIDGVAKGVAEGVGEGLTAAGVRQSAMNSEMASL